MEVRALKDLELQSVRLALQLTYEPVLHFLLELLQQDGVAQVGNLVVGLFCGFRLSSRDLETAFAGLGSRRH